MTAPVDLELVATTDQPAEADRPEPATRSSLHEEAIGQLRNLIVQGTLAPGSRVPERVLCERLGISRTPLREALKLLATEGLVELNLNRGATIARLTVADVDEVFPVMGAIEALSGELACARITEEQLAEIRALHYQMALHYHRQELPQYFALNEQIHECIQEAAGNPTLSNVYRSLAGRIRRARYLANMTPKRWSQAVSEHEAILEALADRDGPRLAQILREHLHNKCETVKEALLAEEDIAETG